MSRTRRVRATLLVLLWVWAACVFLTLDLFLNVPEFDKIRPRAPMYHALRDVAHRMVGEPLPEEQPTHRARLSLDEVAEVRALQRKLSFRGLSSMAATARQARARIAAIRGLACLFGPRAKDVLLERVHDPRETEDVRATAARYLYRTGLRARASLQAVVDSDLPRPVREGAAQGLRRLR